VRKVPQAPRVLAAESTLGAAWLRYVSVASVVAPVSSSLLIGVGVSGERRQEPNRQRRSRLMKASRAAAGLRAPDLAATAAAPGQALRRGQDHRHTATQVARNGPGDTCPPVARASPLGVGLGQTVTGPWHTPFLRGRHLRRHEARVVAAAISIVILS